MRRLLKQLFVLAIVAGAGYLLWQQRGRIAAITNPHLRVQGTWYLVDMDVDRKGLTPYYFSERIITVNDSEWGSYELRKSDEIEVMTGDDLATYRLEFPDESDMIWLADDDGEWKPAYHWRE